MAQVIDPDIEKILAKPPQYTRLKRHLGTLLHHSSLKKLINLIGIECSRKIRQKTLSFLPYIIIVDTGNICNLKCPLCPTGCREKEVSRRFMELDDFKSIIDYFAPWAYEVTLHNWGEPFLNKNILKMIRYCAEKNIGTNLSSNLNHMPFSPEELVRSGLEYLIVSLDGTTQNIYEKYRVSGNIHTVLDNLKAIIQAKERLNSNTPLIEWQFLVMKHNYHQIVEAKELSRQIGVDVMRFIPVGLPFDASDKKKLMKQWYPYMLDDDTYINDRFLQKPIKGGCFYLYRSVTITPLGNVAPCCAVWKDTDNFGNIFREDFRTIWNNKCYTSARALFTERGKSPDHITTCCDRCSIFER